MIPPEAKLKRNNTPLPEKPGHPAALKHCGVSIIVKIKRAENLYFCRRKKRNGW
jgi:hypothetical protein